VVLVGRLTEGKPLFGFQIASGRRTLIAAVTVPIMVAVTGIAVGPSSAASPSAASVVRKVPVGTTNGTLGAPRTVSLAAVQSHEPIAAHAGRVRPVLRPVLRVGAHPVPRQHAKVLTAHSAPSSRPSPRQTKAAAAAAAPPTTASYVAVATTFPAMSEFTQFNAFGADQNVQPPDTQVAANRSVILEAVNNSLSIWLRTPGAGPPLAMADLNQFFGAPAGSSFSDPRLAYDSVTNHFFLTGMVFTQAGASTEYIAVSQTSDPLGLWRIYQVRVSSTILGDQPKLGFNSKVVAISWADFNTADQFVGQETWILDKAQLIAGTAVAHTTVGPDPDRFDIVPAVSVSATDTEYLTYNNSCGDPTNSVSDCTAVTPTVGLISITGSPAEPGGIVWHEDDLTVAPTAFPPTSTGLPAPDVLTGDDRFLSTTFAYGDVLTSGGDSCTPNGASAPTACARVIRVAVGGASPAVTLDAAVGRADEPVTFPAVAADPAGNIFIAANLIDAPVPQPAVLTVEAGTNFVSAARLYNSGYLASVSAGDRWGDYSSAAVDPLNPYDIIVGVETPGRSTTASWGTSIGIATLAAPVITGVSPASGPTLPGSLVTITGHDLALDAVRIGTAVTFGGVPAAIAAIKSVDTLMVVVPAHAAGPVDVQVTTDNGISPLTPADVYTYRRAVALMTRDAHGILALAPGNGSGGFASSQILGSGWNPATALLGPGDFDGDGHVDLISRTTAGALLLCNGRGLGKFSGARVIGSGWQHFTAIVTPGDFDGDGHVDLIARTTTGALILYPGSGTGGFHSARTIGSGWQAFTAIIGVGDPSL